MTDKQWKCFINVLLGQKVNIDDESKWFEFFFENFQKMFVLFYFVKIEMWQYSHSIHNYSEYECTSFIDIRNYFCLKLLILYAGIIGRNFLWERMDFSSSQRVHMCMCMHACVLLFTCLPICPLDHYLFVHLSVSLARCFAQEHIPFSPHFLFKG